MVWVRLRRALRLPPREIARRLGKKARRVAARQWIQRRDRYRPTYEPIAAFRDLPPMRAFRLPETDVLAPHAEWLAGVTAEYLAHRFDLLGSGWTRVHHGMTCRGCEGHRWPAAPGVRPDAAGAWLAGRVTTANLAEARRLWSLIDRDYEPIDWHLDWKSGRRWDPLRWYQHVTYGDTPGADVKLPWELARMQHLPQLALAHALARAGRPGFAPPARYVREVRNQILDFLATNPPRFGVNWTMPMDVAIRIANWIAAVDLLRAAGVTFDAEFEAAFARAVYEHARHVVENLEWSAELRGNHYLADVCGLVWAAAYLPRTPETDRWLALGVQELVAEVGTQFTADGANFEASTAYHRLSAEMVVYTTALVLGLPAAATRALETYRGRLAIQGPALRPGPLPTYPLGDGRRSPFPGWYLERVARMAEFTRAMTKPDGRIPQIGDNDSGRFFRFWAAYERLSADGARARYANLEHYDALPDEAAYWDENGLDHRHLVAAVHGLFGGEAWERFAGPAMLESHLVRGLAGAAAPAVARAMARPLEPAREVRTTSGAMPAPDSAGDRRQLRIPLPAGAGAGPRETIAFPEFGLYLLRTPRLYLAIHCGPIGQNDFGGHAHNDQLGLELQVDGRDWIADPGTYLYTPALELRDAYRSAGAHFAPAPAEREPGSLTLGPFLLGAESRAVCERFGPEEFRGVLRGRDWTIGATVRLEGDAVVVEHHAVGCRLRGAEGPWTALLPTLPYSPGYGKRLRAPVRPPLEAVRPLDAVGEPG